MLLCISHDHIFLGTNVHLIFGVPFAISLHEVANIAVCCQIRRDVGDGSQFPVPVEKCKTIHMVILLASVHPHFVSHLFFNRRHKMQHPW